jgi:Calponin homology (CH) domain
LHAWMRGFGGIAKICAFACVIAEIRACVRGYVDAYRTCVRRVGIAANARGAVPQGLLWTIISKFQVADIVIEGVSGKDGLLLWCKRQTMGYPGVEIDDFARSWESGMAFLAILHKHRPECIDMPSIDPARKAENMALAFRVAEEVWAAPACAHARGMGARCCCCVCVRLSRCM